MVKSSGSAGPDEGTIQYVQVRISKKVHSDAKDKAKSLNLSANAYYTGLVHRDLYVHSPDSMSELIEQFSREMNEVKTSVGQLGKTVLEVKETVQSIKKVLKKRS